MKLGDLKFRAEDFDSVCGRRVEKVTAYYLAKFISDEANRILREKIEKAGTINGWIKADGNFEWYEYFNQTKRTHTARLVCIEEIKK